MYNVQRTRAPRGGSEVLRARMFGRLILLTSYHAARNTGGSVDFPGIPMFRSEHPCIAGGRKHGPRLTRNTKGRLHFAPEERLLRAGLRTFCEQKATNPLPCSRNTNPRVDFAPRARLLHAGLRTFCEQKARNPLPCSRNANRRVDVPPRARLLCAGLHTFCK